MSYNKDKDFPAEAPKPHKIRITLTSKKVDSLEKVCRELIERAKGKELRVKGPVRLPTLLSFHFIASDSSRTPKRESL